ncbi:HopJ type III effector protein [Endozoicomonas sp.]|uniref:HopJ type III effector protein n=1 Tax=Endozoicomonas sp. TaxID=1892382 RepID=UPI00383A50EB
MILSELLEQIRFQPGLVEFEAVMSVIADYYHYTPTRFVNGRGALCQINEASNNEGSCKIFAFARIHDLSPKETLACFGRFYREEVLLEPDGSSHGNIRAFMVSGWDCLSFDEPALVAS